MNNFSRLFIKCSCVCDLRTALSCLCLYVLDYKNKLIVDHNYKIASFRNAGVPFLNSTKRLEFNVHVQTSHKAPITTGLL